MTTATGKISFHGAARRHYADADLLGTNRRDANAGHLYGFVAECGLKALLVAGGLRTEPDGDITRNPKGTDFRWHVDTLVTQINMVHSFLDGRTMSDYLAHIPDITNFCDWSTAHRYYAETHIPSSLENWHIAASQVMKMLDIVKADGKI